MENVYITSAVSTGQVPAKAFGYRDGTSLLIRVGFIPKVSSRVCYLCSFKPLLFWVIRYRFKLILCNYSLSPWCAFRLDKTFRTFVISYLFRYLQRCFRNCYV